MFQASQSCLATIKGWKWQGEVVTLPAYINGGTQIVGSELKKIKEEEEMIAKKWEKWERAKEEWEIWKEKMILDNM